MTFRISQRIVTRREESPGSDGELKPTIGSVAGTRMNGYSFKLPRY